VSRYTIARGIKYKELKDILPDEIDIQIKLRQDLQEQMVGRIYPSMIQSEINKLKRKTLTKFITVRD
jgi:hypothetical protein